jgi:hypothetical protein
MSPIRLTDSELAELQQAALMVPHELRAAFLERVAAQLRGRDLGPGLVRGNPSSDSARTDGQDCASQKDSMIPARANAVITAKGTLRNDYRARARLLLLIGGERSRTFRRKRK